MLTPNRKHALGVNCTECKTHNFEPHDPRTCPLRAKKKRAPSKRYRESQDQKRLVAHMRERGELVIRMEQGEERDPWIAQLHRALGMEPGATDLLWVRPRGRVVFIECKADDGELRQSQVEHHAVLLRMGHMVITGYGHAELIAAYEAHRHAFP